VSNYSLDSPDSSNPCNGTWDQCRTTRANTWASWYSTLAQSVKNAAASYNSANNTAYTVSVVPILNGNISNPTNLLNPNTYQISGGTNTWITKVIRASDNLAFDDYHCDDNTQALVTDPSAVMNALADWQAYLSNANRKDNGARKLIVTENGFAGYLPNGGAANHCIDAPQSIDGKYKGMPSEQATYFANLFQRLQSDVANFPDLRSFSIWETVDNPGANDPRDQHFGILDSSQNAKPSVTANVRNGIATNETANPPSSLASTVGVTLPNAAGVPVPYNSGTDYAYLTYKPGTALATGKACSGKLSFKGSLGGNAKVLVHATNTGGLNQWNVETLSISGSSATFPVDACTLGSPTSLDLYFTADQLPATAVVTALSIQ
jgi:hypothetical protein